MSEHCQKLLFADQQATCQFCGEEYTIADSDAWEIQNYCCGECEVLDEAADED